MFVINRVPGLQESILKAHQVGLNSSEQLVKKGFLTILGYIPIFQTVN